jgi:His/Glu/Gln/Arg/opine family amino acid ABC transporter permease subunit
MFEKFWQRLFNILKDEPLFLLKALGNTLIIAFCGFMLGLLIGALLAILRSGENPKKLTKFFQKLGGVYILIIRGTPIVVQLLLLYFVFLPSLKLPELLIAILAFGMNSGAYLSETIRGAIQSIDKGQKEAAGALGLSYGRSMTKIILPQAFKNVIPSLGNEIIALVKETAVVGFITVIDITRASQMIVARTYDVMAPYILLALIYLTVVYLLTLLIKTFEKKVFRHG